jgi:protein-L-isoaspartate(D-aspartate) O-methyltransferase
MSVIRTLIFIPLIFLCACQAEAEREDVHMGRGETEDGFYQQRLLMVQNQIARRGVNDTLVLQALRNVPRHRFVSPDLADQAYDDNPLPIGQGQTISQPYIVALMTELLLLKGGEKVLEIGTGSGYQAAVLAEICDSVYTVEIVEPLAVSARERLAELGYNNIKVIHGDGYRGFEEAAPYHGIIVTAAPTHVPEALLDQLKVGGRLVIPVGDRYQYLKVFEKTETGIKQHTDIAVRFVPMTGEAEQH